MAKPSGTAKAVTALGHLKTPAAPQFGNAWRRSGKRQWGVTQEGNSYLTWMSISRDDRGKRRLDAHSAFPALNMPTP